MSKMTFNHKAVLTLLSTYMLSMGNGMAARKPNMVVLLPTILAMQISAFKSMPDPISKI